MSYQDILKQNGLRITKVNILVLNLLKKTDTPLSAKDIWLKSNKKINLVSIYRVLDKLINIGLIQIDSLGKDRPEKIYHLKSEHHHHFVCKKCNQVSCVPCKLETNLPKNFKLLKHQIQLSGLCNKCN